MKKILVSLTAILLLINCSQDSNSITGNYNRQDLKANMYSKQTTMLQDLSKSIPIEISNPVTINGLYGLAEFYSLTWFNNLIGTYWEFSNVESTGNYYTQWVYTENINHPIPKPKSLKFIGGGQHIVDEKILDVSFIEWKCGAYGKNNPDPLYNTPIYWSIDNNDGECTNGNAWSTLFADKYLADTGYVDYTIWPDYVSLGFHVDVSSIYPSARISGPIQFPKGETARFYVTVSGGFEPYNYQWWVKEVTTNPYRNIIDKNFVIRRPPTDVWVQASGDEICDHTCYLDFYIKCVVTDKNGNADTSNILFVDVTDDDVWPPRLRK